MIDKIIRASAAQFWRISFRNMRNRNRLYMGEHGIRSITFHDIPESRLNDFKRIIDWCRNNYRIARPSDAERMLDGKLTHRATEDSILITFDDGHADNHRTAEWLHKIGIEATFFIVPSFVDRSNKQYLNYHHSRGIFAHSLQSTETSTESQGLSRTQISEMLAMGHHIAAHNYAHRDLGQLSTMEDLDYEILNSIKSVESFTGRPCKDFAIGFGQPDNLSDSTIEYLSDKDCRVYMCFRGLNTPGISPRYFLRHGFVHNHPFAFTTLCLQTGADHKMYNRQQSLASRIGVMPEYI